MLTVIFILISELKCVCRLAGHDGFGDGQGLLALKLALVGVKLLKEKFGVLAVDGIAGGEPAGLVPEAGVSRLRHGVAGRRQPARPRGRLHHDPVGVAGAGFAEGEEMHDEFRPFVASGVAGWVAYDFHKSGFLCRLQGGGKEGFFHGGLRDECARLRRRGCTIDQSFQSFAVAVAAGNGFAFEFDQVHAHRGDADI